jgi:hypothetical protein
MLEIHIRVLLMFRLNVEENGKLEKKHYFDF